MSIAALRPHSPYDQVPPLNLEDGTNRLEDVEPADDTRGLGDQGRLDGGIDYHT